MNEYYFTFQSLTAAQRASNILKYHGIYAPVVSTPALFSPEGCGYSIKIIRRDYDRVKRYLDQKLVPYRQVLNSMGHLIAGEGDR